MREKTVGKIYLIVGICLAVIHPFFSMASNRLISIETYISLNPYEYQYVWFWKYGLLAIILAGIGVYFIRTGYLIIKETKKD